jgi:hypothetical protein
MSRFLNDWDSAEEMFADFEDSRYTDEARSPIDGKENVEVLLASYTYENYSGNAFVLFRDTSNGQLYEVNGSHCSCYGLGGRWDPEPTSIAELRYRLTSGSLGRNWDTNEFADELAEVLNALEVTAA